MAEPILHLPLAFIQGLIYLGATLPPHEAVFEISAALNSEIQVQAERMAAEMCADLPTTEGDI